MKHCLRAALVVLCILAASPLLAATCKVALPKCSGRVVWVIPKLKAYVLSNNPLYGKKPGSYACESKAILHGYHMRPLNIMRPLTHPVTPHPSATQ